MSVDIHHQDSIVVIAIDRPSARNAVDRETADALATAFRQFEKEEGALVAVLTGRGGHFCAGADLKALAAGAGNRFEPDGDAPMGPTRMQLSKPVIAAVEGYAVAGGLELALWCDLRVAADNATQGVFCRRFGVPLIDRGTIVLPRLIGQGRALDLILTGREVDAEEALAMGVVNRVVPAGNALEAAMELAKSIAQHPQRCMRNDRTLALAQWTLCEEEAIAMEFQLGMDTIQSGETRGGATQFRDGQGRGGRQIQSKSSDS